MNILELSEKRFSARKYTAEPVAQSDLDYIMECVRLAPSAVNKQQAAVEVCHCAQRGGKAEAVACLRPRMVSHGTALHCLHEEQQCLLDTRLR